MTERNYIFLTEKEIEEQEKEIDKQHLQKSIRIRGVNVNTIGELRKYITSVKRAKKFENYLEDDDYYYILEWIIYKERKKNKSKKL